MLRVLHLLSKFKEEEDAHIWNGKRNSLYQQDQYKTEEKECALQKMLKWRKNSLGERNIAYMKKRKTIRFHEEIRQGYIHWIPIHLFHLIVETRDWWKKIQYTIQVLNIANSEEVNIATYRKRKAQHNIWRSSNSNYHSKDHI